MKSKKKIILVSSKGGHFAQLLCLEELFVQYDYLLLTENAKSTASLIDEYNMKFLKTRPAVSSKSPMFLWTLITNGFLTLKIFFSHYPKVIITTGSYAALPVCVLAKLLGIKVVYIVSYARVRSMEKTASFLYKRADEFIVQWPEMKEKYPKSKYFGGLY